MNNGIDDKLSWAVKCNLSASHRLSVGAEYVNKFLSLSLSLSLCLSLSHAHTNTLSDSLSFLEYVSLTLSHSLTISFHSSSVSHCIVSMLVCVCVSNLFSPASCQSIYTSDSPTVCHFTHPLFIQQSKVQNRFFHHRDNLHCDIPLPVNSIAFARPL